MITIQIELIIIVLLILIVFIWAIWYRVTQWRLKKKYNPENDKSKEPEEIHGRRNNSRGTSEPSVDVGGPSQVEGPSILPTTNINSSRKNRKSSRRIIGRRRRRG